MGTESSYLHNTYRILTVSPVHIQGADTASEYGQCFFRDPKKGEMYLVDAEKLQVYLLENYGLEKVREFAQWLMDQGGAKGGIDRFLNKIKFNRKDSRSISKGVIFSRPIVGRRQYFIRTGLQKAYIPGTTIKGAIRTALLWKICKALRDQDPGQFDCKMGEYIEKKRVRFEKEKTGYNKNKLRESFGGEIARDILQGFKLESERVTDKHRVDYYSPFTDIFRCIKVQDSSPIDDRFLRGPDSHNPACRLLNFKQKGEVELKKKRGGDPLDFPIETYFDPENKAPVSCRICLDYQLLKNFIDSRHLLKSPVFKEFGEIPIPFSDIDGLMSIVFEFYEKIWRYLTKIYTQFTCPAVCSSKQGKTSGMVKMVNPEKRFGFITSGNRDIYFSLRDVRETDRITMKRGVNVEFILSNNRRGPVAKDIVIKRLNISHLSSFYSTKGPPTSLLKIGWGTGLLGTSLAILFLDSDLLKEKLIDLRDYVMCPPKKRGRHGPLVPKTARVICNTYNEPLYPLGWIRLEKEGTGNV